MPSSILLAVLVGAGVLALLPALVRRYDASVRSEEEITSSTARVLAKRSSESELDADEGSEVEEVLEEGEEPAGDASPFGDRMAAGDAVGASDADDPVDSPAARSSQRSRESENENPAADGSRLPSPALLRRMRALRRRRRRLLLVLMAATTVTAAIAVLVEPWVGITTAVGALLTIVYVQKLRAIARAEHSQRIQARAKARAAELARRYRAVAFARDVAHATQFDDEALARAISWLSLMPRARTRPPRIVMRVLRVAEREAYRSADGGWSVRKSESPPPRLVVAASNKEATGPASLGSLPTMERATTEVAELNELPQAANF